MCLQLFTFYSFIEKNRVKKVEKKTDCGKINEIHTRIKKMWIKIVKLSQYVQKIEKNAQKIKKIGKKCG